MSIFLGLKLHVVLIETHVLSVYPFMTFQLAVLCGIVALGYAAGSQCGWSTLLRLAYGAVLGLATVAIWNMRITHGLIAIVALACVAGLLLLRGSELAAVANRCTSVVVATASCLVVGIGMHPCCSNRGFLESQDLKGVGGRRGDAQHYIRRLQSLPSVKISDLTTH